MKINKSILDFATTLHTNYISNNAPNNKVNKNLLGFLRWKPNGVCVCVCVYSQCKTTFSQGLEKQDFTVTNLE
jgi:hypothetical protein